MSISGAKFAIYFSSEARACSLNGTDVSSTGYSNLVTYDLLFHLTNREAKFRPYVAGGAGVKVYTGGQLRFASQPFPGPPHWFRITRWKPRSASEPD